MTKTKQEYLIPFDIVIKSKDGGRVVFSKGLKLQTFIDASQRWYNEASEAYIKEQNINKEAFDNFLKDIYNDKN